MGVQAVQLFVHVGFLSQQHGLLLQACRVEFVLAVTPGLSPGGDVRPVLLGRMDRLFLKDSFMRFSAVQIEDCAQSPPSSSLSSFSVA